MKMRVCWMFLILLGCRFSQATKSKRTCTCTDLKSVCVAVSYNVSVPCPDIEADEMTFSLLKDHVVISNCTCSRDTSNVLKCRQPQCRISTENQLIKHPSVSFILTPVNNSSHGIYWCEGTALFPPPLKKFYNAPRIRVFEDDHLCKCSDISSNRGNHHHGGDHGYAWIWILAIVLLSIYSITVTAVAFINWVKLRKVDSQSDYMNTKPRAPRDRRKKKGVQNPFPRYL